MFFTSINPFLFKGECDGQSMWHVMGGKFAYRNSEGKSEGKRPLGRPRLRWEDNNKIDLQEVDWLRIGTGGGHY